jgi:hypothetical protein
MLSLHLKDGQQEQLGMLSLFQKVSAKKQRK